MAENNETKTVPAGALAPWEVGQLPPPPSTHGWQLVIGLLGPGLVLASTAIGSGEWLFGPAVTAQYGASLLWLATLSIGFQVFCNLMIMRYAIYCGEPIIVGGLRTWPGPRVWIPLYLLIDVAGVFPYNAANAAVALAAAILGRLPTSPDDLRLVKVLGYVIFLLAFVPLFFGGTIYRMIERIMTFKIFYVLIYLTLAAVIMVPASVWWEVTSGFFQFGTMPLRSDSIVAGNHFNLIEREGDTAYLVRGTVEGKTVGVVEFAVVNGTTRRSFKVGDPVPDELKARLEAMKERAEVVAQPGRFLVRNQEDGVTLVMEGSIGADHRWRGDRFTVEKLSKNNLIAAVTITLQNHPLGAAAGSSYYLTVPERNYEVLEQVPPPYVERFRELEKHRGLTHVNVVSYAREHGRLPPMDWATLAAFTAIAGLGGLANTLFSNYARDKGWGMGKFVGAIPSMVGGRTIGLSHVGKVFPLDEGNRANWRGWMRHIRRDQLVWLVANFIGMALPCMLALEFIRHATVADHRVSAMTAEGMAGRYPDYRFLLWMLTLFCGFVILAPGQIIACDQVARRWTDIIWTGTRWSKRLSGENVKYVYYGILCLYAVIGLTVMTFLNPMQLARAGAVLMNVALGCSAWHALYINRSLMPRELRPNWFHQAGTVLCGFFFVGISVIVLLHL